MTSNQTSTTTREAQYAAACEAARRALGLETLEDRNRDALDFHDLSVGRIRAAIRIAFDAGHAAARGEPSADEDLLTAARGLVAFVEDLEATHCGLDDFTGNYPALPDALAFARAAVEKARPR